MKKSICGIDCDKCELQTSCKGCKESGGHPFGGECMLYNCCNNKSKSNCNLNSCKLKAQIIKEFNELNIPDMPKVTELNALQGSFINMEYMFPSGQKVKLFNDNNIYLGNQLEKKNSNKCYGLTADKNYLLVCEYGENGSNPNVIIYKKRNK